MRDLAYLAAQYALLALFVAGWTWGMERLVAQEDLQ